MLEKLFGGDNFNVTTAALNTAALRQEVIANNLANINTPGYKRQEVHFEEGLQAALARRKASESGLSADTPDPHLTIAPATIVRTRGTSSRTDGNNVDAEYENVQLAANSLKFEALADLVTSHFSGLKAAINSK